MLNESKAVLDFAEEAMERFEQEKSIMMAVNFMKHRMVDSRLPLTSSKRC